MKLKTSHLLAGATWTLMCVLSPTIIATAQDGEKQKPGATVDAWRQSLPPEAEAQTQAEEMPGVATSLSSNDETHKTLLALERRWMESLTSGDADTLSEIISSDFTFASSGVLDIKDRTKYLEYALRELRLASYEFDKTTVRIFGRTAIVTGLLKQKASVPKQNASVGGQDSGGSYLVTDVWISRGGNWRAVSRHESLLPDRQ